ACPSKCISLGLKRFRHAFEIDFCGPQHLGGLAHAMHRDQAEAMVDLIGGNRSKFVQLIKSQTQLVQAALLELCKGCRIARLEVDNGNRMTAQGICHGYAPAHAACAQCHYSCVRAGGDRARSGRFRRRVSNGIHADFPCSSICRISSTESVSSPSAPRVRSPLRKSLPRMPPAMASSPFATGASQPTQSATEASSASPNTVSSVM